MANYGSEGEGIYTVLALVSVLTLLAGVIYVWYRAAQVTGNAIPFLATGG